MKLKKSTCIFTHHLAQYVISHSKGANFSILEKVPVNKSH